MRPRDYQIHGIEKLSRAIQKNQAALDMSDMGTGKTFKAVWIAKKFGYNLAVICPAGTIAQWKDTARKCRVKTEFVVSYQKAVRGNMQQIERHHRNRYTIHAPKKTLWVFDEVHNCRNYKALNSKLLMAVIDQKFPVLMASATPFETPIQFCAIGHALGTVHKNNWYHWCLSEGRCKKGDYGGMFYVGGPGFMKQLRERIEPFCDRVRIAEVGQLPELTFQTRVIEPANRKAIDESYVELLQISAEESEEAIVERLRLRQIVEHEKLEAEHLLGEEFLDAGQKIVHFTNFTDSIENLRELYKLSGRAVGVVDGKTPVADKERDKALFQKGGLDVLLVNIQSGGAGLNLQDMEGDAPRTSIINLTDGATWFRQACGRTYRENTKSHTRIVVPIARGTVECEIEANLNRKFKNLEALTDADLLPS